MIIVEVFTTPNQKTRSGLPLRWRWRIVDNDSEIAKGRHSFRSEDKAIIDLHKNAEIPPGAILRRPDRDDVPWRPAPLVVT